MIELQQWKPAIRVLDTVVKEDTENGETWYLLAFSHYSINKFSNANECLKNALESWLAKSDPSFKQVFIELSAKIAENHGEPESTGDEDQAMERAKELTEEDVKALSEESLSDNEDMVE